MGRPERAHLAARPAPGKGWGPAAERRVSRGVVAPAGSELLWTRRSLPAPVGAKVPWRLIPALTWDCGHPRPLVVREDTTAEGPVFSPLCRLQSQGHRLKEMLKVTQPASGGARSLTTRKKKKNPVTKK